MSVVIVAAPAKLTLSLRITGIRDDGFHLIEAEMVSVDLADQLEFSDGDGLEVIGATGLAVTAGDDNLVRQALRLVDRKAHVRLTKAIAAGAGLGGGSSDAAAVLRWAGFDDVEAAAAWLGADVAFCLVGGRAQVSGVGEVLVPLAHRDQVFTLATPPLACSTPAVYAAWDAMGGPIVDGPNDLEPAALVVEPELARYRDLLGEATGATPVLAGSGSTWFVPGAYPHAGVVVHTLPPH